MPAFSIFIYSENNPATKSLDPVRFLPWDGTDPTLDPVSLGSIAICRWHQSLPFPLFPFSPFSGRDPICNGQRHPHLLTLLHRFLAVMSLMMLMMIGFIGLSFAPCWDLVPHIPFSSLHLFINLPYPTWGLVIYH